jgi:hypothetical protein
MPESSYDAVLQELDQASKGTNLRCGDLINMLERLGFVVTRGHSGNHYTFYHPQIQEFTGGNFNGGSGRNGQLLPVYVRSVRKVLRAWEDELRNLEA